MHKIFFYKDKNGNEPVLDYLKELSAAGDKDSRIKLNKLNDYIEALSTYGLQLREPYVGNTAQLPANAFFICLLDYFPPYCTNFV